MFKERNLFEVSELFGTFRNFLERALFACESHCRVTDVFSTNMCTIWSKIEKICSRTILKSNKGQNFVKTWEEMRRVIVPISKHSQTAILWTYQPPSKKNNTIPNSTSHWQEVRNLAKVPYWQCTCPRRLAHLLGTFGHGNISIPWLRAQNYSTIRLLTRVKFDGISPRTPELEHLPRTVFIRCLWIILSPIKASFVPY